MIPEDLQPILREISRTIDAVLNPGGDRVWGYVLLVAPIGQPPPVQTEVLFNVTQESVHTMLLEGAARMEGRVVDNGGTA